MRRISLIKSWQIELEASKRKKEVLAKRKATEATLEQQRAEVKASYAKLEAAKNAAIASAQSVEAAKYEVYWAEKSGDATKIETAQKRLATAQDQAAASRKAALAATPVNFPEADKESPGTPRSAR